MIVINSRLSILGFLLLLRLYYQVSVLACDLNMFRVHILRQPAVHLDILLAFCGVHNSWKLIGHADLTGLRLLLLEWHLYDEAVTLGHEANQLVRVQILRQSECASEATHRVILLLFVLPSLCNGSFFALHHQLALVLGDVCLDRARSEAVAVHGDAVLLGKTRLNVDHFL